MKHVDALSETMGLPAMRHSPAFAIVLIVGGCAQVLDVDQYHTSDEPRGDPHVDDAELPLLPALPDAEYIDDCEACAATECANEREECLESERCTALLRCSGGCSDPNCVFRCRDTIGKSAIFEDYYGCVIGSVVEGAPVSRCPADCNSGKNWACVDAYRWDRSEPDVRVDVQIYALGMRADGAPFVTLPYVEVAGCEEFALEAPSGDNNCTGWTSADAYGQVQVHIPEGRAASLAIRGGARDEHRTRAYGRPFIRSGPREVVAYPGIVRNEWLPATFAAQGVVVDPTAGLVSVNARDCLGVLAPVSFQIDAAGSQVPMGYVWVSWGNPLIDEDGVGAGGGFVNVPPGPDVVITALQPESRVPVAKARVITAAGWTTEVQLYPTSSL